MRFYSYIAHYEETLRALAEKGHQIHFTFDKPPRKAFDESRMKAAFQIPNAAFDFFPDLSRATLWSHFADLNRRLIDYLRYFHPDYEAAPKLKKRAERRLPWFLRFAAKHCFARLGGALFWIGVLKRVEMAVPVPSAALEYLKVHRPDLVMFTPLVDSNTPFIDYAKAAESLGIRSVICVASWDNLTNKGLIQCDPDAVLVWNEFQKKEAVRYHSMDASKVIVTGAQTFDKWFEKKPSLSKGEFMSKAGLKGCESFIAYVCSSGFIAKDEVPFIRRWLGAIRSNPVLGRRGVILRPHPANPQEWEKLEIGTAEKAVVYPQWEGLPYPFTEEGKTDYFHTLYYADAVVGINSSAMIEAGIQNKPVFTILADEFKETQEGTLHFFHIKDGGLLSVAGSLEEHVRQLEEALGRGGNAREEKIRAFIREFVRPHGLDEACTPYVARAIEDVLRRSRPARPSHKEPPPLLLFRGILYAFIVSAFVLYKIASAPLAFLVRLSPGADRLYRRNPAGALRKLLKTGGRRLKGFVMGRILNKKSVFRDWNGSKAVAHMKKREFLLMRGGDPLFDSLYGEALARTAVIDKKDRKKTRVYNSIQLFRQTLPLEGETAECGCWQGLFSYIACRYMQEHNPGFAGEGYHIFDSFRGLPAPSAEDDLSPEKALRTAGKFAAPLDTVRHNLSPFPNIAAHPGWIPRTFEGLPERKYKFVHVDLDLYHPTKSSIEYFYPRLVPNGILICDDYASPAWPGAKRAVDEYCREQGILPLALSTGQAVLLKGYPKADPIEEEAPSFASVAR